MNIESFSDFFSFLSPILLSVGLFLGILYHKKINSLYKSITIYLGMMLLIEILIREVRIYGSNFILLPIYTLIELCFFTFFYKTFLLHRYSKLFVGLGILGSAYIIGETIAYFVLDNIDTKEFQPYAKVVDNFIIILMALAFYLEKISQFKESGWKHFKLNTVILAFFTITILVFLPFNFMINETTGLKHYFWVINTICLILFELYLTYSIWQNARQNKLKTKRS
jgi:hypothetical protein